ncbi:MAG: fatty acid CoA ligase family protein [Planctomycetaceae bacterium]
MSTASGLAETALTANRNVAARLFQQAIERPDAVAIREPKNARGPCRYVETTFRELADSVQDYMFGLQQLGITRGTRVVVMVPPSRELIRLVYALLGMGAVMVLVDPGMGIRNLGKCLAEAQPEAFLGIWKAQIARRLFGWAKSTLKVSLTISQNPSGTTGRLAVPASGKTSTLFFPQTDDPAAVLFTSGSTGVPKGAVYTHGIFASQVEQLHSIFGIAPGDIDLCTFPLFALFAPALGMTSIIPRMDFTRPAKVSPWEITRPAIAFRATNLFGSPALLNRVGRGVELLAIRLQQFRADPKTLDGELDKVARLPAIRRVLSAGAPVSAEILERFLKLIPADAQIYTPYGATESLPVAVIGSREVLEETRQKTSQGAGTCVGRPVPEIEVKIIRISDVPIAEWSDELMLPTGEIGEICVYGPVVTQEYFRRPELTALAKIPDPARGRKWHRMGDVGYFDAQGRLWFCGRKSQRVVTATRTYFTDPVEGIFNTHPAVFRTALVGITRGGQVEPVLCVELERRAKPPAKGEITRELLEMGAKIEMTRSIREILFHRAFPVDIRHNSKIFREKLAVWAQRRIAPGETPQKK